MFHSLFWIYSPFLLISFNLKCAIDSKNQPNQDANALKDQLSVVVKAQLDFQQRIEKQISMLQTMMQTVCQVVNNEMLSNKKCTSNCTIQQQQQQQQQQQHPHPHPHPIHQQQQSIINSSHVHRDQTDIHISEPRQNWLSNNITYAQRSKPNPTDELFTLTQRTASGKFHN